MSTPIPQQDRRAPSHCAHLTLTLAATAATITVHNGLVVNNREEFKNRVLDLLAEHPEVKRIVIDLGSASYVDTSGLGVLLRCTNLCRARGVHFVIRGVRDDLLEFWRQTNIDKGLELEHG